MAKLAIFRGGFSLEDSKASAKVEGSGGKRGKISSASAASFRRLREFCVTHYCNDQCWGITLTVPGLEVVSPEVFRAMHHKLVVWCNDNNVPLIWRVELQQRGQPHLHCVTYGTAKDCIRICNQWYRCLHKAPLCYGVMYPEAKNIMLLPRDMLSGARYAVCIEELTGDFRSWRYLVSHMSKGKQSQLGWIGRQWGVCCRNIFLQDSGNEYFLTDFEKKILLRFLKRLVNGSPAQARKKRPRFNKFLTRWKLSHQVERAFFLGDALYKPLPKIKEYYPDLKSCAFWVCNPETIQKLLNFVKAKVKPIPF